MDPKITPTERTVLLFIKEFWRTHNQSPTLNEIKKGLAYKSLTSIQRPINSLEQKGLIKKEKNIKRSIKPVQSAAQTVNLPIVGAVRCGLPTLAFEDVEGYIATDKQLIKGDAEDNFYLRAKGDSMDTAGIMDGDLLLVHSQSTAHNGQIVVALIDDEATVKIFKKGGGYISLVPSSQNTAYKPIILREDFAIQGVVTRIIHD